MQNVALILLLSRDTGLQLLFDHKNNPEWFLKKHPPLKKSQYQNNPNHYE